MNIQPQHNYLYKGLWSPVIDELVLDTLIKLQGETKWSLPEFPSWFLLAAAQTVETNAGVLFTETELKERVETFLARYRTFKAVVNSLGVQRDLPSKSVIADDDLWQKMFKKMPLAAAYYYKEEPLYSKLACLFGLNDIKIEGDKKVEVIVISDNTEELPTEELSCYEIGDGNDEVNSPAIFPPPTVRRKLFRDEAEATDKESTTEPGIYFIDLAPDGQLRTRLERSRDLAKPTVMKQEQGGPSTRSPYASSCGSNSPIGWWSPIAK